MGNNPAAPLIHLARSALDHLRGRGGEPHVVYQTSTIAALLSGVYEGDVTVAELLGQGDFGLGTFNSLDGEMVILDGTCYRLRADGSAGVVGGGERTPFAVVTTFRPQTVVPIDSPTSRPGLSELVAGHVASSNLMHAVRVTGEFAEVHTRTVERQDRPFPPLVEATRGQAEAVLRDVAGTLAGFVTPDFEQGISVAGHHLHFLAADARHGGHALDFTLTRGSLAIDTASELRLSLPTSGPFLTAALSEDDLDAQIREAEGGDA